MVASKVCRTAGLSDFLWVELKGRVKVAKRAAETVAS